MELYIVLAIMVFMIFGFILNKWPFGVTTMVCCVLLALSGVFTIPQAFSGLIAIGNPLMSSPDFPPHRTVHESFPSHGAPSNAVTSELITLFCRENNRTVKYHLS